MLKFARHTNSEWNEQAAQHRLASLNISTKSKVRGLSGGQRSQLALTIALAKRPRLLVLDEPMADLDPIARHDMMEAISVESRENGTTIIVSSHVLGDVISICERLIVMSTQRPCLDADLDTIRESHLKLTGPESGVVKLSNHPAVSEIRVLQRSNENVTIIIRTQGDDVENVSSDLEEDGWAVQPLDLEQLALAYVSSRPNRSNSN